MLNTGAPPLDRLDKALSPDETSSPHRLAGRGRIPRAVVNKIDFARGTFALLVIVAHAAGFAVSVLNPDKATTDRILALPLMSEGYYGVIGFFVVSGFCIQLSVDKLLASSRFPFKIYSIARLTRILPIYYITLLFVIFVESITSGSRPVFSVTGIDRWTLLENVFLLTGFLGPYGCFSPAWTITFELFYYFFYAVLLVAMPSSARRSAWFGMAICVAISFPIFLLYRRIGSPHVLLAIANPFWLGTTWFLGVFVAIYLEKIKQSALLRAVARMWPLALLTVYFLTHRDIIHLPLCEFLLGPVFSLMIIDFFRLPADGGRFANSPALGRISHALGLSSYPTYLLHMPILVLVGSAMLRAHIQWNWTTLWLFGIFIASAAAIPLGLFLERPMMAWRGKLLIKLQKNSDGIALATAP